MPLFTPPIHEEPMRTNVAPLCYFRLTWANSVVRENGTFRSVRSPILSGIPGIDYFQGGRTYQISDEIADELEAAGFSVDRTQGYGVGPYGQTPYGE